MQLGPPHSPLPPRWWFGLTRSQIARVVHVERHGTPRVCPTRHPKGYVVVYIGRGHPYARSGGVTYLHRWVASRERGRKLEPYEHVHHHETHVEETDPSKLHVLHAIEHGQFHYGRHFVRGEGGRLVWVGCGTELTDEELETE